MTFVGALVVGLASSYAVGYIPSTGLLVARRRCRALAAVGARRSSSSSPCSPLPVRPDPQRPPAAPCAAGPGQLRRSLQGGVAAGGGAWPGGRASWIRGNVVNLGIGLAFGLVCLSLVPLTGWGGYVSICQLTFAGLGASPCTGSATGGSVLGLLMAAVLRRRRSARVISLPALRLRGLYLALADHGLRHASWTTCSSRGRPSSASTARSPSTEPTLFGLNVSSDKAFTIFLAVVFALFSIALLALRRGPFGRVLVAAKDSEAACATLGRRSPRPSWSSSPSRPPWPGWPARSSGRPRSWPAAPTSRCSRAC